MTTNIKKSKLNGTIQAPPSKSYAHRYLIAAALSHGKSTISNVDFSDDIMATLDVIHAYGKKAYRDFENHLVKFEESFTMNYDPTFDCKESGTTLRIFFPIALSLYDKATFIGSKRLIERGIDIYESTFKYISFDKDTYSIKTKGTINPSSYELPGNVSSQYVSGLLYALPLLKGDSKIALTTNLESKNYVDMTLDVLSRYGIKIQSGKPEKRMGEFNEPAFMIPGKQTYTPHDFTIEGDFSNAAFLDAFNYFDNNIEILGLNPGSLQSDKIYKKYFDMLDKDFSEINMSNSIDLGPILITFAALKHGARFTGTNRLKIKESDRGNAITEELRKCGANIKVLDDEIIVEKNELTKPSMNLNSHNDHRIAMSLSLLSTQFDISIDDSECIKKSYPQYFNDLKKLNASIE